ncbi:prolipoprotein diacylglyceryl transferase [Candidatus Beckwithbacteria bacterium CG10_big_fil_rev_8_21_14_0_10_34_10]|uniref:Phosphatidylglycerol--prolipoprotein diacylglyceryl transferase n=1 Tax=Candidatus Beckwithbacteria bacterium CG10_big_fil_rev_8_21_14_0_10_34_10 TaxID=1974495 RepID=A0A2H0W7X5_9BACT|nr:MAG: prolipoprotein diacylglyceryl transferase [Candidatus Beckwithbacteria bacterium CG10_big_fil_rev_8_21_14_0_10_34_10]
MRFNPYGFFIALGIGLAVFVVEKTRAKLIKKRVISFDFDSFDILPWLIIPGLVFARLYHVFDYWLYYRNNLVSIFYFWQGGLGILGAFFGAFLGIFLFLKSKLKEKDLKTAFLTTLDLIALGLPLGQAIGRFGNFFNQELYGLPTNLPWKIYINPENRIAIFKNFSYFHPLFLYESIICLIIFFILFKLSKRRKNMGKGTIFSLYLLMYSVLRFLLEFLRPIGWEMGGIRVNQIVSLFFILISVLFLLNKVVKSIFGNDC